ncbi:MULTISPECIES: hypothetical protein [Achromobacter]|jgi:hypothetical protein|uniref:hypothetical protein n=1 Tax=Achromobacter TaxID=222 RepID=UPI001E4EBD21|nr:MULTISPECIES: hypothetical protein [Achromobacter]
MGVEYDDIAGLFLQAAVERRGIVTGERHTETVPAQAQRQLLPEVRIILKQADTQQTICARHIQSAFILKIVDKCPSDRHAILSVPQATILRLLQWKRMIAEKKTAIFRLNAPIFRIFRTQNAALPSIRAHNEHQDEQLTSMPLAQSGGRLAYFS